MRASIQTFEFLKGLEKLILKRSIVSISGESGTGKTTLALYLVGNLLKKEESCIWIQAGERFPIRRLEQLFKSSPNSKGIIKNNIFIIPKSKLFHSYEEQSLVLQKIVNPNTIIPPSLKFIVIDNISHHLRYEMTHCSNLKVSLSLLDSFYESQLMPLILFCRRDKIVLFLIHEITYCPILKRSKPFFYKLYDRIDTIDIILTKIYGSERKNLEIIFDKSNWNFQYMIDQSGILFV
jgi:archaellum biogenesis ATPase FlaH